MIQTRSAIKQAARKQLTNSSSYIRTAILNQLWRDGYDPNIGDAA